jgi:hypothetical protein
MTEKNEDQLCLQVLKHVHGVLSDPNKWTRKSRAVDQDDDPCHVHVERATKWSLVGAVERSVYEHGMPASVFYSR